MTESNQPSREQPPEREMASLPELVPSYVSIVAGPSVLGGLMCYGATLAFAAMYVSFIVRISRAAPGRPPALDSAVVSAAAALAGVLGSAFALYSSGQRRQRAPREPSANVSLRDALYGYMGGARRILWTLRNLLSLDPPDEYSPSWPLTFGIWVYACVASAVAITYVLNQNETPGSIKALAISFGGYVLALITTAYGVGPGKSVS